MPFCQTCKGHYFESDRHRCPPKWRCWDLTGEEDPKAERGALIYAFDGESAAEKYVEGFDEVSHDDVFTIAVRPDEGGKLERWKVTAELTMTYHTEPVEEEPDEVAVIESTGEPVDEDQERARTERTCWRCEGTERFEGHVCDGCGSVADGAGETVPPADDEPVREAVEPLVGMPRFRAPVLDRIEVDGTKPGGVIARFVILGNWHEVELPADRFDREPCATMDDLERLVLRDLEDCDGVRPTSLSLRPLVKP